MKTAPAAASVRKPVRQKLPNEFNFRMNKTKGAYLPHDMAFPSRYVISPQIIGTEDAKRCQEACKYNAVDLEMKAKTIDLKVGAMVWATGWEPYDAAKIDNLGFGQIPEHRHQHDDGTTGCAKRTDKRKNPEAFRRQGARKHRFCTMCRIQG